MLIIFCELRLLIFRRQLRTCGPYVLRSLDTSDGTVLKFQPAQVETRTCDFDAMKPMQQRQFAL